MTKKFITVHGVRKLNPEWKRSQQQQQQQQQRGTTAAAAAQHRPVPFANAETALAVIPSPAPVQPAAGNDDDDDEDVVVAVATPVYEAAVNEYRADVEPEIFVEGGAPGRGLDELNRILAKYEVPAGMLSKLLLLRGFDAAEIIVDDSGSMTMTTDARGPDGSVQTRWWEAKHRISQMMEILAYVAPPPITVRFLNRNDVLRFERNAGEPPRAYIGRVEGMLLEAFNRSPTGTTPALEAIQDSFARDLDRAVLRYFLGDGVPNGGRAACREIERILMNRPNPSRNPFTFMSCTNDDAQTEWMKECEERAPYTAELDDYEDEAREILLDQGQAFPYSYGLHLVAQIVAAFCPDDLDAMDESVPFTKQTLDDILGYRSSANEYRYYFDSFVQAQRRLRQQQSPYQRNFVNKLPSLYEQFEAAAVADDVAAAAAYKRELKSVQRRQMQQRQAPQQPAVDACCDDECCIL